MTDQNQNITPTLSNITTEIPLWEARWPQPALEKKRLSIGTKRFGQQYQNRPTDLSDLTFPNFDGCIEYGIKLEEIIPRNAEFYCGVDISSSKRPGCVIFTFAYDRLKDLRIVWRDSIKIGKWKGPVLRDKIIEEYQRFGHRVIFVETNSIQQAIFEFIKEKSEIQNLKLPIRPFQTHGANKQDPTLGLEAIDVQFETGKWLFIGGRKQHEVSCHCNMCKCIVEFNEHPDYSTQDIVMAAWFASTALRRRRSSADLKLRTLRLR